MILKNVLQKSIKKDLNDFIDEIIKLEYSLYDIVSTLNVVNIKVQLNFLREFMYKKYEHVYCNILSITPKELWTDNFYNYSVQLLEIIKTKYTYLSHISNPMSLIYASIIKSDEILLYFILDDYFTQIKEKENVISN